MKVFKMIKVWKIRKQAQRVEFERQERLIAEHASHVDSHGFHLRTHWPD